MISEDKNIRNKKSFYRPELDGLRFFAFLLVFIHHHPFFQNIPVLKILNRIGWVGVDLFFVLSAYLFTKLLVLEYKKTNRVSYRKFYIRRILRIWPIYYLFVVFCIVYKLIIGGDFDLSAIYRMLGLFTFTDNIASVFWGYNQVIPFVAHLWTISFEEQFYVIVPALILFLVKTSYKFKIRFFIIVFISLLIIRTVLILNNVNYLTLWLLPFTHYESILFGIVLGFFEEYLPKLKTFVWIALALICFPILSRFNILKINLASNILYFLVGLFTTITVAASLKSELIQKFLSLKPLVFLGKRSYGLYLFHFLGIFLGAYISDRLFDQNLFYSFLISLGATILISVLSYKWIESPFLKLKKKFEIVKSRPV